MSCYTYNNITYTKEEIISFFKKEGDWKYEVFDGDVNISKVERQNNNTFKIKLKDLLPDSEVLKAYYNIEDIEVIFDNSLPYEGSFENETIFIKADVESYNINTDKIKSTLLHELQHKLQKEEGFFKGGNPSTAFYVLDLVTNGRVDVTKVRNYIAEKENELNKVKENLDLRRDSLTENELSNYRRVLRSLGILNNWKNNPMSTVFSMEFYRNLAGEVESRNVQTRMNMTEEERIQTLLQQTEDVSREDQIFLRTYLGTSMSLNSPQRAEREVIDRLKQNGLANNVFEMNTQEINAKLEELGVDAETRKQIAYNESGAELNLDGKKLNLYHSTTNVITGDFRIRNRYGFYGVYFASSKKDSKTFGDRTYKVSIKPKNTLIIQDNEVKKYNFFNITEDNYKKYLEEGYDSIAWYQKGKIKEFIVLDTSIILDKQIQFQKTLNSLGINLTVNGFVYKNDVYLNLDKATNETTLHEFSHLYNSWLKQSHPELYNRGLELVKAELENENSEIKDIIDYAKTTQPTLKGEALLEEILTELTGRRGAELIENQKAKKSGIIDWILDVWNEIANMLGLSRMKPEQVANLTLGQYAEAVAVDLLAGEKLEAEKAQEYFTRNADRLPLTLSVFQRPEFVALQGKQVNPITVLNSLNQTGIKQIEKDLIKKVIEDNYQGQKKISYDELEATVRANIMPLERIFTSSYADYGMNNLGDGNYGEANTIILNAPIEHGVTGHFSGDFKASGRKNIKYIPKQLNDNVWVAVEEGYESQANDNNIYQYVGTAGTNEAVEGWIENYEKPLKTFKKGDLILSNEGDFTFSLKDKNGITYIDGDSKYENFKESEAEDFLYKKLNSSLQEQNKNINKGMFGHIRVWQDGSIFNVAELQSDYFQKNNARKDILEKAVRNSEEFTKLQEKATEIGNIFRKSINNLEEQNKKDLLDFAKKQTNIEFKLQKTFEEDEKYNLRLFIDGKQIHTYRYKFSENQSTEEAEKEIISSEYAAGKYLPQNVLDYKKELENKILELENKFEKEKNNLNKELEKEREKVFNTLSPQEKQFIVSQKEWEKRMVRETVKEASLSGATSLRFPTPYTLSVIEGYLSEGAPYEIENANDSTYLEAGDRIYYAGEYYTVVDSDNTTITIAESSRVSSALDDDIISDRVTNSVDNDMYEIENDLKDFYTEEEWNDFRDNYSSISNTELNDVANEIEEGVFEVFDGKIRDIVTEYYQEFFTDAESIIEDIYGDDVWVSGNTITWTEGTANIETLMQPSEYKGQGTKDSFSIEDDLDDTQQTVARKYEEIAEILKQERGEENVEIITDVNGFDWYETKIQPSEVNKPVIAFQKSPQKPTPIVETNGARVFAKEEVNYATNKPTGRLELELIESDQRGQGNARKALNQFLEIADAGQRTVSLVVSPRDNKTSFDKLIKFYESVGFRLEPSGIEMVRKPKKFKTPIEDKNGEPKLEEVTKFITNQNKTDKKLDTEEKAELLNFMISNGYTNFEDLKTVVKQAFYNDMGMFTINPQKLVSSRLYDKASANSLTDEVQPLIEALLNTDMEVNLSEVDYEKVFDKTLFGNFRSVPRLKENAGNTDVLNENLNPKQNNNTKEKLLLASKVVDSTVSLNKINNILSKSDSVIDDNLDLVQDILDDIVKDLSQYGIDLVGLDTTTDIKPFLSVLKDFITNPNQDNVDKFSEAYNNVFMQDVSTQKVETPTDKKYYYSETKKSEQEVFEEQSLIKQATNLYYKVRRESVDRLLEKLNFVNQRNELEKEARTQEGFTNPEIALEVLLYKKAFKTPTNISYEVEDFAQVDNFSGDYTYLTTDFVADFHSEIIKEKLKNSIKYKNFYSLFDINEKGIYLKNNDSYSLSLVEIYADNNLRQYSLLSKQLPNLKVTEVGLIPQERNNIVNNKQQLKEYKGNVYRIDNNNVIIKGAIEKYLKIDNQVFESVQKDGELSLFSKIVEQPSEYYQIVEQPLPNLDIKNYSNLKTTPEKFLEVSNLKSKAEIEKIKQDNFDCV